MDAARLTLLEPPRADQETSGLSILARTNDLPTRLSHDHPLSVRPVTFEDTALLVGFIAPLSDNARQMHFFRLLLRMELMWQEVAQATQRELELSAVLVATAFERGQECAIRLAELVGDPAAPATTELAMVVRDDEQRRGVARLLLLRLSEVARQRNVYTLHTTIRGENWSRQLLCNLRLTYYTGIQHGELSVWADLRNRQR